jgi:hypothetical protein
VKEIKNHNFRKEEVEKWGEDFTYKSAEIDMTRINDYGMKEYIKGSMSLEEIGLGYIGRPQYIYHAYWNSDITSNLLKFCPCIPFFFHA